MRNYREFILVFAIAGLLLVLGSSSLKQGSPAWKKVRCADNLRKVHQVALQYQDRNNGAFQPVITRTRPRWTYWYDYLLPGMSDPRALYCPAHPRAAKAFEANDGMSDLLPPVFDIGSVSYGMNFMLSSSGDPRESAKTDNIKRIADPAYVIYFGDCKMPTPALRPTKWCWKDDYNPVHENQSQFIFIDGHVAMHDVNNLGLLHKWENWKADPKRWTNCK